MKNNRPMIGKFRNLPIEEAMDMFPPSDQKSDWDGVIHYADCDFAGGYKMIIDEVALQHREEEDDKAKNEKFYAGLGWNKYGEGHE